MMRRRSLGFVAALSLLVGVSACAVQSSDELQSVASTSSPSPEAPGKYGFSWLDVESDAATVYVPAFTTNAVVALSLVRADALASEVCRVSVVGAEDDAEVSGPCELLPIQRYDNGSLNGLRVKLLGLEPGDYSYDVQLWPVAQDLNTGALRFDYEPPAVARLNVYVPAA